MTDIIKRLRLHILDANIIHEIEAAISRVIRSNHFIQGPEVEKLEAELSAYVNRPVVTVASGTDALMLAIRAMADMYGFRVAVTTPFSFTATASAIRQAGLRISYADIDPETFNLNTEHIPRHELVVPVHLYGTPCSFDHEYVVEDACQAFGAKNKIRGKLSCFSFFPSKPLGAYGDGGAVAGDADLIQQVRTLAHHGSPTKYRSTKCGTNSRLDEIQAAILRIKLKYVEGHRQRRLEIAKKYNQAFKDIEHITPPPLNYDSSWHCYTIRVASERRDAVLAFLQKSGIDAVVQYPVPLHHMRPFEVSPELIYGADKNLRHAEEAARSIIGLPICASLNDWEIDFVIQKTLTAFK